MINVVSSRLADLNFQIKHLFVLGFLIFVKLLKHMVFGTLSEEELLILSSKTGHTLWEFVTGFLVFYFNADFGHKVSPEALKYGGLFLCVLLVKFYGFLIADRVHKLYFSHSMQAAGSIKYPYLRLGFGIAVLNFVNLLLVFKFVHDVMWHRFIQHNVFIIIFGFEILNYCPIAVSTSFIFALNCYETIVFEQGELEAQRRGRRKKLGYIYALEFFLCFFRLGMTASFSLFFLYRYTFPFHSMPSSYISLKMTIVKARALVDLLKRDMMLHKLKVPAETTNGKCIVCYEELRLAQREEVRYVVPCEHSFHNTCLKRWLNISPTCPVCRCKV